jgi:hypothetical protein
MKIITTANSGDYYAWFARAAMDPTVWPFTTFNKWYPGQKIEDDDWSKVIVMDDTGSGVLEWHLERANGLHSATVNLWVLNIRARRLVAAALLSEVPALARRYGVTWIDASCHESNELCLSLLTKHFGEPWGRKPGGAWNGRNGQFETSMHFRILAASLCSSSDL